VWLPPFSGGLRFPPGAPLRVVPGLLPFLLVHPPLLSHPVLYTHPHLPCGMFILYGRVVPPIRCSGAPGTLPVFLGLPDFPSPLILPQPHSFVLTRGSFPQFFLPRVLRTVSSLKTVGVGSPDVRPLLV